MELFGLFAGLAIIGILLLLFLFLLGIIKWLLQGFFLYQVADAKNLDLPLLAFLPFGTFYLGGQMYDGNILGKGQINPKTIGLIFAIAGLIVYVTGLSIGDIAISYIIMESIAFLGIFKAYSKSTGVAVLLAVLNIITAGIAAIIILFLYKRKLGEELSEPVVRDFEEPAETTAETETNVNTDDENRM
ncbi:hypothetical protein [Salinicoccus halodurans]|uniref:Uncharacterized protein n=1 Tax=Salinicoccus halodurans TaxID=407035 RepID=A0A0F7D4U7_9STAP|nr:hypothetical protein [Salinicoccus halodurans]AKG74855.1 hypothetical protein AAT16_12035 [Salinicoccus halodurans]SFK69405.1 hypothetical protein SAMN05216235_1227 [Salinicoccus halodurans]